MDRQRICITGGSGLLALNLAASMTGQSDVTLATHSRTITPSFAAGVPADLETEDGISRLIDKCAPNWILHTAALTNVEQCEAAPDLAYHVNVRIPRLIARICVRRHVRFIQISTDHLFDGLHPMSDETAQVSPLNVYGRTKADAEKIVLDTDPSALVIRTNFFAWGPSYRRSLSDFVLDHLCSQSPVSLFTDSFITPILASDLAAVLLDLVAHRADGIFNAVGDERISKYEFGCQLARQFGLPLDLISKTQLEQRRDLVRRPLDMSLSNAKLRAFLKRPLGGIAAACAALAAQADCNEIQELRAL